MDDLYWEIFASELSDINDPNLDFAKVESIGSFPPCPACKSASHLCRTCKLKLFLLWRQQQTHARPPHKSHLERLRSAESQPILAGTDSDFLQYLSKVTMPKPATNEEQGEEQSLRHNST